MVAITTYKQDLLPLVMAALNSPGLLDPNEFNLARYSLNAQSRNRLLDPDILALEDYLIDYCGLPEGEINLELLHAFGDIVYELCSSETTSLMVGYQYMGWLLAWLNSHHLPSFFGDDPDSPLQVLQMAAALGFGEWASLYNQIEEGLERMFTLANSPLWRVREVSSFGLQRMMLHSWERTLRRLRYQTLIANLPEWYALLAAWRDSSDLLLRDQHTHLLDVYDLLQTGLRFIAHMDEEHRQDPLRLPLINVFHTTLANVVRVNPELGFAQLRVWAMWDSPDVKMIIRCTLMDLEEWSEKVAEVTAGLGR